MAAPAGASGSAHLQVPVVQLSAVKRVVDVRAAGRVHAAHRQGPQVLPPRQLLQRSQVSGEGVPAADAVLTSGVMAQGIVGRKLSTAWEKGWWGTSCSSSSTSCSVSFSPALPRLRTKWPWGSGGRPGSVLVLGQSWPGPPVGGGLTLGYLECLGHPSMATMIL